MKKWRINTGACFCWRRVAGRHSGCCGLLYRNALVTYSQPQRFHKKRPLYLFILEMSMNQFVINQQDKKFGLRTMQAMTAEEVSAVSGGLIPLVLVFAYGFTSGSAAMGLGLWLASGR
jgi:hypothetical protein